MMMRRIVRKRALNKKKMRAKYGPRDSVITDYVRVLQGSRFKVRSANNFC
jgi:hypothetical protein